jgi:beta-glucosidase
MTALPAHRFPAGFHWGVATSAQQVEGAVGEAGRGESVWDRFAASPGRIADGTDPSVACDHFHLWKRDIELMREIGVPAYRFSVAWPRIVPAGRGALNPRGLDFYDRLVDGLLRAGITPFLTLNHWDTPQALQDQGGWASRDTAGAFVEYATAVARHLGDRVKHWITHNEPWCQSVLGHQQGQHAPGHTDPAEALAVAHHLLLSHGWATGAIRGVVRGARVGLTNIHMAVMPASDSPADLDAARSVDGLFNRWYLDPLYRGAYPADVVADRVRLGHLASGDLPFVHPGDMAAIATPTDFLGVNYYSRAVIGAGPDGRAVDMPAPPGSEVTEMGWEVYPEGLHDALVRLQRDYAPGEILITENGAAFADQPGPSGRVADARRVAYLGGHIEAAGRALAGGVPLTGYFVWSLLDNWEWALGYGKRFGLVRVDYPTQRRTLKDSAHWYRSVIAANAATDDAREPSRGGLA